MSLKLCMPESLHQVATQVKTARIDLVATLRSMTRDEAKRKEQGERLKAARMAADFRSARSAAMANNWPESTVRAHEAGTRTIGQDDAENYARRYRAAGAATTAKEILFGSESAKQARAETGPIITRVPLLSWVSAGRLGDAENFLPADDGQTLAFSDLGRGTFYALRVQGDSMDRISPDGSIIIVNQEDKQLVAGRFYVFARRGQATYKRWHANPDYLAPFSTNPSNEPIFIKDKRELEVLGRVRRTVLDL